MSKRIQTKTALVVRALFEHIHNDLGGDVSKFNLKRAQQVVSAEVGMPVKKAKLREILKYWRRDGYLKALVNMQITHEDLKQPEIWARFLDMLNDPRGWMVYLVCSRSVRHRFKGQYSQPRSFSELQTYMEQCDIMFMRAQRGVGATMDEWKMQTGRLHRQVLETQLGEQVLRMDVVQRKKFLANVLLQPPIKKALESILTTDPKMLPYLKLGEPTK